MAALRKMHCDQQIPEVMASSNATRGESAYAEETVYAAGTRVPVSSGDGGQGRPLGGSATSR
jgi:hypothetical protein